MKIFFTPVGIEWSTLVVPRPVHAHELYNTAYV